MELVRLQWACALGLAGCHGPVDAAALPADGSRAEFVVNADLADGFGAEWAVGFDNGAPAQFRLTISGDRLALSGSGRLPGTTGMAVDGDSMPGTPVFDHDAALANELGPLDATSGALKSTVSPGPEPASVASMFAGLVLSARRLPRRGASK